MKVSPERTAVSRAVSNMQAEPLSPTPVSSWTPSLSALLLGAGLTWAYYYLRCICKRPRLVAAEPFRQFLESRCPAVKRAFRPTFWCVGGRIQTIVRVLLLSKPSTHYRNEVIATSDGGQVSLDWIDNEESTPFPESSTRPTIILLPGLTGNSQQSYILHLVHQAKRDGYRCVVFNNRGFGGERLLTHRTFCAANTDDLDKVVEYVKGLFPEAPLLAVGVSLGGMVLLNYLASSSSRSLLQAALVFSTAWNVFVSNASLEKPLNYFLFNLNLAKNLCNTVNKFRDVIGKVLDVDHVLKSRSIREFDERYTSVVFGYQTCDDYYHHASPYSKLSKVKIPVLCLNAADDPFSPGYAIPVKEASANPNVALLITAHGGHIGFMEGFLPTQQRYMNQVFSHFTGAVLHHSEELKAATTNGHLS